MLPFLVFAAAGQQQIIISNSEPKAASPWTHTYKAACGPDTIEIVQWLRPLGASVTIRMNGLPVGGDLSNLKRELGEVRAAYRFQFLCSRVRNDGVSMRWVRGLFDGDGHVDYRSGAASFRNGTLLEDHAEESNEETFWYR